VTITKHAKERLAERFNIRAESEIYKLKKKFERDFFNLEEGKQVKKTIIWHDKYLQGVFIQDKLITVINLGYTPFHSLNNMKQSAPRFRNKNRRNARYFH
jgi:hypothetical protein